MTVTFRLEVIWDGEGNAVSQVFGRRLPNAVAWVRSKSSNAGFIVDDLVIWLSCASLSSTNFNYNNCSTFVNHPIINVLEFDIAMLLNNEIRRKFNDGAEEVFWFRNRH
jgi:hypothetical protein